MAYTDVNSQRILTGRDKCERLGRPARSGAAALDAILLRAPCDGTFRASAAIGDAVAQVTDTVTDTVTGQAEYTRRGTFRHAGRASMLALPEVIVFGLAGAAVIAAFALLLSVVGDWSWAHPSHRAWAMIVTGSVEVVVGVLLAAGGVLRGGAAVHRTSRARASTATNSSPVVLRMAFDKSRLPTSGGTQNRGWISAT